MSADDDFYFNQIASVLEEAWAPEYTYIGVLVDMEAIQKLQLELTLDDIKWAIVAAKKLKIKQEVRFTCRHRRRDI